MPYTTDKIRNIAILGHGNSGKTVLAENMLYMTGKIDRQGKVNDGNTVSDSDSEEIKRQISIYLSAMHTEHKGCKINLLDTPGFFDFAGEVVEALRVADTAIIACSTKDGISVGFEKSWSAVAANKLPRAIFISKIDEENSNTDDVIDALRKKYGTSVCPFTIPVVGASGKIEGVYDLVYGKAYAMDGGKQKEISVPDSMKDRIDAAYEIFNESIAETCEELMEKYGEEYTTEEIIKGVKIGLKDLTLFPVFCGCAMTGLGTMSLLTL